MKRILVALALGAMSSSAIFAIGDCTGPNATLPGGTGGFLQIYGSGSTGADINNVSVQSGTTLPVDNSTVTAGAGGGNCVINGATFSNFQVVTSSILGPVIPTGFNLSLSVNTAGTAGMFSYSVTGAGDSIGDIELFYQIGASGGTGVTSMTLSSGAGSSITETICSVQSGTYSAPQTGCAGGGFLASLASVNGVPQTATFGPASVDYISKDIDGGSENVQDPGTGSTVPEPMSLSLMGIGLLGVGLLGRRARS